MFEEFEGMSEQAALLMVFLFAVPHLIIKIYKIDLDKEKIVFNLFLFFFLTFGCYRFFIRIFTSETPIVMAICAVIFFMMTGSCVKKLMLSNTN